MALIPWRNKNRDVAVTESSSLSALRDEMDRLFENFVRGPLGRMELPGGGQGWMPAVEVAETDQDVTVRAELPGIDAADLDVNLTGNTLTISGEKKDETQRKEKGFYQSEIRFGSFRRAITLPEGIDPDAVEAKHANGVLTVRVGKLQKTPPRRIDVQTT